jgi:hypothetical protein
MWVSRQELKHQNRKVIQVKLLVTYVTLPINIEHRIKRRSHSYQSMTTFLDDDDEEEDQDMILRRSRDLTTSSFSMVMKNIYFGNVFSIREVH